jgi:hypothetical protein
VPSRGAFDFSCNISSRTISVVIFETPFSPMPCQHAPDSLIITVCGLPDAPDLAFGEKQRDAPSLNVLPLTPFLGCP